MPDVRNRFLQRPQRIMLNLPYAACACGARIPSDRRRCDRCAAKLQRQAAREGGQRQRRSSAADQSASAAAAAAAERAARAARARAGLPVRALDADGNPTDLLLCTACGETPVSRKGAQRCPACANSTKVARVTRSGQPDGRVTRPRDAKGRWLPAAEPRDPPARRPRGPRGNRRRR